jgi:hypothetical protein
MTEIQNSKQKNKVRHPIGDRNVLIIGICNFDIACPVK